jgi:beta-glucosidase
VVADYYGVAFLHLLHHVAVDLGDAAAQALAAGVDVELPTGDAYVAPLEALIGAGQVDEALIDRAVVRVLRQKQELGLLDATFDDLPPTEVDLDSPEHRVLARRLAEESVVLLTNDGTLPLGGQQRRIAVIGPNADRPGALFGCYSFLNHVLVQHPEVATGIEVPTIADAMRTEFGVELITGALGCGVDDDDRSGFDEAVASRPRPTWRSSPSAITPACSGGARSARAATGRTSGFPASSGNWSRRFSRPARPSCSSCSRDGRTRSTGPWRDVPPSSRRSSPGGRRRRGRRGAVRSGQPLGQASRESAPILRCPAVLLPAPGVGWRDEVTNLSSTPALPFGHGLSYTTFEHTDLTVSPRHRPTEHSRSRCA